MTVDPERRGVPLSGVDAASPPCVLLLHGPNLNLLGTREPEIYGTATLGDHVARTEQAAAEFGLTIEAIQSNHEGELVDAIHDARGRCAAIIINPGAFTHYAWSLHDALGRLRGSDRRSAPLQPERPGAMEAHERRRAGRQRVDRRLRRARLRARRAGSRRPAGGAGMSELPPIGYAARPDAVREALDGRTLIVSAPSDLRWLTSFGGSLGWAVIGPETFVLITDGRYADRAAADVAAAGIAPDIVVGTTRPEIRDHVVAAARGGPVVADATHLTHATWLDFATDLELEPDGHTIRRLRRVKDRGELARIAHAAEIADVALTASFRSSPSSRPRPTCATSWSTACAASVRTDRATTRSSPVDHSTPPDPTTTPAGA